MRLTKELLYGKIIRGFEGTDPEPVAEMLNAVPYGGIIFFRKNILNYSHLGEFIAQLKSRVARPLLLCIDQEMGVVNRIREGLPPLPGGREFAALPREERKEAAATLECSESTVKSQTARALATLRADADVRDAFGEWVNE